MKKNKLPEFVCFLEGCSRHCGLQHAQAVLRLHARKKRVFENGRRKYDTSREIAIRSGGFDIIVTLKTTHEQFKAMLEEHSRLLNPPRVWW